MTALRRFGSLPVQTTTRLCNDCPATPADTGEWLGSVVGLAAVPWAALLVGVAAVAVGRPRLPPEGNWSFRRAYAVTGVLAGLGLVIALTSDYYRVLSTLLLTVGLAGGALVLTGDRGVATGPAWALVAAVAAWAGGWLVASVVTGQSVGGAGRPALGLSLVLPLGYPLGAATGSERPRPWLAVVVAAMLAAVAAAVSAAVPFQGGPAFLLVPVAGVGVLLELAVAVPLVAVGAD